MATLEIDDDPAKAIPAHSLMSLVFGNMKAIRESPTNPARTLSPRLSPGADRLDLSIAVKTGLFSGSFVHPTSLEKTFFNGAVLQKQDTGGGLFRGPTEFGYVEFGPR